MSDTNSHSGSPHLVVTARDPASGGGVAAAVGLLVQALSPDRVTAVRIGTRPQGPRPRQLLDPWRVRQHHAPSHILWTNPSLRSRALVRDASTHALWRGRAIAWVHGWDAAVEHRLTRRGPLHALLVAAWRNTRLLALSPSFAARIDALELSPWPASVLPPPFDPCSVADSAPNSRTLLFLGRLSPEKNPHLALEALLHLPTDVRLILAGDGPLRDSVRQRVTQLGLDDRVELPGYLQGESKRAAFARASALVLPSTNEGLPLSVLEAAHAGLPVISADVGAIRETLPADSWFSVGPLHPQAIAEAIQRAWNAAHPHPQRARQSREAVQHHVPDAVAHRLWQWIGSWDD